MIDHDAATQSRRRIDIDAERQSRATLEMKREGATSLLQQGVCEAMDLNCLVSFEEEQGLERILAGRITLADRGQIGASGRPDVRISGQHGVEYLAQQRGRRLFAAEPSCKNAAQRIFETA